MSGFLLLTGVFVVLIALIGAVSFVESRIESHGFAEKADSRLGYMTDSLTLLKKFATMQLTVMGRSCPRCNDPRHIKPSQARGYARLLTFACECVRCHRCDL